MISAFPETSEAVSESLTVLHFRPPTLKDAGCC